MDAKVLYLLFVAIVLMASCSSPKTGEVPKFDSKIVHSGASLLDSARIRDFEIEVRDSSSGKARVVLVGKDGIVKNSEGSILFKPGVGSVFFDYLVELHKSPSDGKPKYVIVTPYYGDGSRAGAHRQLDWDREKEVFVDAFAHIP